MRRPIALDPQSVLRIKAANQVHYGAGQVAQCAIAELGGTMPENLPTVESIKKPKTLE
jgi:hypothetical protein